MLIIGIDPGAGGAIAFRFGTMLWTHDMPADVVRSGKSNKRRVSAGQLAAMIRNAMPYGAVTGDVVAYVEQVGAMPGQGVTSMFAFGRAAGIVEGVLAALEIPTTLIAPTVWKRAVRCPAGKDGARARAAQLFPARAADFARVKDDGRAEAALIAHYGATVGQLFT